VVDQLRFAYQCIGAQRNTVQPYEVMVAEHCGLVEVVTRFVGSASSGPVGSIWGALEAPVAACLQVIVAEL
jgi:hypothetical protein